MTKLSDTGLAILMAAAQRDDRLAELPAKLPAAARNAVARSLVKQDLLEQVDANTLRITDAGFRALNLKPPQDATTAAAPHSGPQEPLAAERTTSARIEDIALYIPQNAAAGMSRQTLRSTAHAVLVAWHTRETQPDHLTAAIDQLRTQLAARSERARRDPNMHRKLREAPSSRRC